MTVDLVSPRPDVVFMRRRLKAGERVSTAPVAVQTSTNFLSLSQDAAAAGSASGLLEAPTSAPTGLPKKPAVAGRIVLSAANPVVRFNARQSAIGSLRATGVDVFGWQSVDRDSGIVHNVPDGATYTDHNGAPRTASTAIQHEVPSTGNRKLVEFYKDEVVVGLRHIRKLRRLILGANSGIITLILLDGANIVLDTEDGKNVAYLSVVGNEVEVRFEKLDSDIDTTFSITTPVS